MAYSLPIEVYEAIRKAVKDEKTAKEVVKAIENSLKVIEEKAREQKVIVKAELRDELRKELATKEDIALVRQEIETVRQEIETVRQELKGEIRELRAYMRFTIFLILFGFTFFNPQFYELVKSLISLFKP